MSADRVSPVAPSPVEAVRRHPRVVLGITLLALAAGIAWLVLRSPSYEGSAKILLTPVSVDDRALLGIELVRDTGGDPTRSVQTAAGLLESPVAAAATAVAMGRDWSAADVRDAVRVEPEGQTNIIAITGRATTKRDALRLANTYAEAALRVRDRAVSAQVKRRLADVTERFYEAPRGSDLAAELADQRDALASVRDGDPTLSLAQRAVPPAEPAGTPAPLLLAVVLALGLGTGVLTALALEWTQRRRPAPVVTVGTTSQPALDEALVAVLARAIVDLGPYATRDAFEEWRARQVDRDMLPKGTVIARRLGGWTVARDRAAAHLAHHGNGAPPEAGPARTDELRERT
jgi:capsular polysaccharide biosynthesis protein